MLDIVNSKDCQAMRFCKLFLLFSGICNCSQIIKGQITTLLMPLAESYLKVYEMQKQCIKLKQYKKEEFFGLRDFYRYTAIISSEEYPSIAHLIIFAVSVAGWHLIQGPCYVSSHMKTVDMKTLPASMKTFSKSLEVHHICY